MNICIRVTEHFAIHLKQTQHCKATLEKFKEEN